MISGKDLLAEERSIAAGLKSPIEVIYENGGDPDEVLKNYALWNNLCKKYNLNFETNNQANLPEPTPAPDDDSE